MAKGTTKPMSRRMVSIAIFIMVFFSLIIFNLTKLQIFSYKEYQQKAIQQQTRDITINSKRGTIYDRNGKELAMSASAYMIYVVPSSVKTDETRELIAENISKILDIDKEKILTQLARKNHYEVLARKVERNLMVEVEEFINKNKLFTSLNIAEDPKRYYPYNNFASHVIGATGIDNQGLSGLELFYDDYLKGTPGKIITATDAKGNVMPTDDKMMIDPINGYSLTLTIDEVIQHFLEKNLEKAAIDTNVNNKSCGIIMNAKTGEILAMSVKPDFDLNEPFVFTEQKVIDELEQYTGNDDYAAKRADAVQNMWRNKAVNDQYMPGSVYKIITAAIACEEKVVRFDDHFFCTGAATVQGWPRPIRCDKRIGHGAEDFLQGFANSCNPVFIEVGSRIGIKNTMAYANAFGLTAKTGIDLPGEGTGIFHNVKTMSNVDLATQSFGQNIKVTPLQMVSAVSAAINGGNLHQPRIVSEIRDENGNVIESFPPKLVRQVISESTSAQVRTLLENVVTNGTGRNAKITGYRIGGKTGTSEKIDEKNEDGIADKRIVSFLAAAPMDDPSIVILIMLDEPEGIHVSGGVLVAPVVKNILNDVLPYMGIDPSYTAEELAKMETNVPKVTGFNSNDAINELRRLNLNYKLIGGEGLVKSQLPLPGQRIPSGGVVMLYTTEESQTSQITVPDVMGLTAEQAKEKIIASGLNVKLSTDTNTAGLIASITNPAAGTAVSPGTTVIVELRLLTDRD